MNDDDDESGRTLTGSRKGFLQLRKEVPSWPRVAVMRVRAMTPGLSPTPEKLYSHSPTASLYSEITASSVDPAVRFTSHDDERKGKSMLVGVGFREALDRPMASRPLQGLSLGRGGGRAMMIHLATQSVDRQHSSSLRAGGGTLRTL